MSESKYNKSIFLFIIVILVVLVAYTIMNLMHKDDVSVVDVVQEQVETTVDDAKEVMDYNYNEYNNQ